MEPIYAVLTGDLIGSSRFRKTRRARMLSTLKAAFVQLETIIDPGDIPSHFEIFRGDSFQGVISRPELALTGAIALRVALLSSERTHRLDARIAVGIGTIDFLPDRGLEGDGEAFRHSGPVLDSMKGNRKLAIMTPWPRVNAELDVGCALLDAVMHRWTYEQSQVILKQLQNLTQAEMAHDLGISQPAVGQRLKTAGAWAVQEFIRRYTLIVQAELGPNLINQQYNSRGL